MFRGLTKMNSELPKSETVGERFKKFWNANHKQNEIRNTNEFPKPEISDLLIEDKKSPFGCYTTLSVAIKNIPIYDHLNNPRYAFFYSYDEVSADLNLEGQQRVIYPQIVLPSSNNEKFAEFYVQMHYKEKDFYLTVVDVIAEKVVYQTVISPNLINALRKAENFPMDLFENFGKRI